MQMMSHDVIITHHLCLARTATLPITHASLPHVPSQTPDTHAGLRRRRRRRPQLLT